MKDEAVLILGATSAVAEHYARIQAKRGVVIVLVGRDGVRLEQIARDLRARGAQSVEVVILDLINPAGGFETAWLDFVTKAHGQVSVTLLAYGALGDQATAQADVQETLHILNANMTSACAWMTLAASYFERQGKGTLIGISSVAGDRGRASNYVYGAAKGGLSIFMEGLAHRFAGSAIRILLVKPGFIDTQMTAHILQKGPLWATPQQVATDIDKAANSGKNVIYTPWFWRLIMGIIRHLPQPIFHKLKI